MLSCTATNISEELYYYFYLHFCHAAQYKMQNSPMEEKKKKPFFYANLTEELFSSNSVECSLRADSQDGVHNPGRGVIQKNENKKKKFFFGRGRERKVGRGTPYEKRRVFNNKNICEAQRLFTSTTYSLRIYEYPTNKTLMRQPEAYFVYAK